MADISDIKIKVTSSGAEEAAEALERLAFAADKASKAIEALNNLAHDGVTIKIIGNLCEVIVDKTEAE